jgi:gamma-glutamyltranspeptidase/glutathione hydrolase
MRSSISILLLATIATIASTNTAIGQTTARNGIVVSANKIASEVGRDVLKKGGNVIDATVATAFALAVVHPTAGNIGGGGFIVFMDSEGKVTSFDFREKAPLAATSDMYLDEDGNLMRDNNLYGRESSVNHIGLKSVGVPGTVAGLYQAHQKYGKLPWSDLVQPAIDLATNGFPMTWDLYSAGRYFKENSPINFLQNYFNNDEGEVTEFGDIWKQPALASTLRDIQANGHDGFYKGRVAKSIAKYMKENGGLITTKDLAKYQAVERKAISTTYKDFTIYSMPPPSSGGIALIEMMNILEQANMEKITFNSAEYVHLVAEVMRRAFADRAEYLGDPDFNPEIPLDKLTSKEFAKMRFDNLDMSKASVSDSSRFGQLYDGTSTTHFSIMDKDGNAVSMTYTLEHSYGSGMGSPELGFLFNNEMGDFNAIPGTTNSKGLIGSNPNLIEPEKRMLSSMTPTIVARDGRPYLVIGSPGGRTIINTVFQTVLAVVEYEMSVDRAIEAMKIHHQWLPDRIIYEKDLLSPDTRAILEKMGHTMVPSSGMGALMGIQWDSENKVLRGAADSSRPDGAAVGY